MKLTKLYLLKISFLCSVFSFFLLISIQAQVTISGTLQDIQTQEPIAGAQIQLPSANTFSDLDGNFSLDIVLPETSKLVITIIAGGYRQLELSMQVDGRSAIELGAITLEAEENTEQIAEEVIPTITIGENDQGTEAVQNISGVLTASRDVFISTAAFTFGPYRFRIRGYDSDNSLVYVNGVLANDPESGGVYWSNWGGLNDVLRNRTNSVGLDATGFSFGGVGGASIIDTRASLQRKQSRISYAIANRSYNNRVMATHSTGMTSSGWALTLSGSRRWAQEGYVPGTFYDAYSYFLSVDKKLNNKHLLNLTAFGAPIKRGKGGAATKELYDLAGTNYYNSYWGYQNGEKRNSRVGNTHRPMFILRHDWTMGENTTLTTAASYQFGRNGGTALDWYDARDPRPDYYRKLPSYIQDEQSALVEAKLREDETARQIDWDYMYNVNRNSVATIENADGIKGNTVTGKRAQYVLEDRRYDSKTFNFNTNLESAVSEHLTLEGGLTYQNFTGDNFKVLDDLLGADFYVDIDKFAEFDSTGGGAFIQNDLDIPNRILKEGDIFGYHYETHVNKANAWLQADFSYSRFDFFLGANVGNAKMWRNGLVRNGKFPDNSRGESEKKSFLEYGAKAGFTYKLDGRNYLVGNATYLTRAPYARNAFISPRTRNDLVEDLTQEKILAVEGGYLLKSPNVKARAMGYFTQFKDQLYNRSLYLDNAIRGSDGNNRGGFVNYIMKGIDTRHMGLELAAEVKILSRLKVNAVAAVGEYIYTSRPTTSVYLDNVAEQLGGKTIYIKNFYVAGSPQNAYSFGLNYEGKGFWFANLNVSYFDGVYLDFYPERRTLEAVSYIDDPQYFEQVIDPDSKLWQDVYYQEKAPGAFTVDFFGGKSWKFNDLFIYLNVGVSNLLDNQNFITGGYEQFRFDFEGKDVNRFPNRYFYSYGRNYFISLTLKI